MIGKIVIELYDKYCTHLYIKHCQNFNDAVHPFSFSTDKSLLGLHASSKFLIVLFIRFILVILIICD